MAYEVNVNFATDFGNEIKVIASQAWDWDKPASCKWTQISDNGCTLWMQWSGYAGMLQCKSLPRGDNFYVVVGVHNYARWCDIRVDAPTVQTTKDVFPLYYKDSTPESTLRWTQNSTIKRSTSKGTPAEVKYTTATGHNLVAAVTYHPGGNSGTGGGSGSGSGGSGGGSGGAGSGSGGGTTVEEEPAPDFGDDRGTGGLGTGQAKPGQGTTGQGTTGQGKLGGVDTEQEPVPDFGNDRGSSGTGSGSGGGGGTTNPPDGDEQPPTPDFGGDRMQSGGGVGPSTGYGQDDAGDEIAAPTSSTVTENEPVPDFGSNRMPPTS